MNCALCEAPVGDAAYFCSRCGEMARTPPAGAPVAGPWRAVLAAGGDGHDTLFGAPAVVLPDDDGADETAAPVRRAPPADEFEPFEGDLDPPEGFRETAWFLDGEDPEALSAIENDDRPKAERAGHYRPENVVVPDAARRRLSLADDADDEESR